MIPKVMNTKHPLFTRLGDFDQMAIYTKSEFLFNNIGFGRN